jgi:hypothetical protein
MLSLKLVGTGASLTPWIMTVMVFVVPSAVVMVNVSDGLSVALSSSRAYLVM